MYQLYQSHMDLLDPVQFSARELGSLAGQLRRGTRIEWRGSATETILEMIANAGTTHERPAFGIDTVRMRDRVLPVTEEVIHRAPFCSLVRFAKGVPYPQPRILVIAPMSGHFATLLRGTVKALLSEHDVYITDWHNARDVPLIAGCFGFDDFVEYIIRFVRVMGRGVHLFAVCQPAVAALAATALMAEEDDPAQPLSMTLMAGPIDTRVNPTRVNVLAKQRPIEWFERNLISRVPWRYAGAFRRVYPGFVQLMAFMSMNIDRHISMHMQQLRNVLNGDETAALAHRRFYDEYRAVMDLPAEFYLETVTRVFQRHDLPRGQLEWRGRRVDPGAIRRTALLTVEGEIDDICSLGQTVAAHDLCTHLPMPLKAHHLQTGAGHYGVFNGRRWVNEVYPRVREMIQTHTLERGSGMDMSFTFDPHAPAGRDPVQVSARGRERAVEALPC